MTSDPAAAPKRDVGLCLSGGGYRAAVFHLGSLIRLNEAGLLPRLRTVSSVSGGSIIAAFLGLRWDPLQFGPDGRATQPPGGDHRSRCWSSPGEAWTSRPS